jgi:hypothetical protein
LPGHGTGRNLAAMHRRFLLLAALVVLASCGSSAARSSSSSVQTVTSVPAAAHCGPGSARTLASSRLARVYQLNGSVYGCADPAGKAYRLGTASTCIGSPRVDHVAVSGKLAAYGRELCGVDTGRTELVVRRLTDGKPLLSEPAITGVLGVESYEAIGSLALRSDGSVAWIATGHSIVGNGSPRTEVHSADQGGQKLLDSGATIVLGSLQLHGSTLTWKHGGSTRTAPLH